MSLIRFKSRIRFLLQNQGVRRHTLNASWIFLEHFLRAVNALLVGIYVARYLGPASFGVLCYITAIVTLFSSVSRLGFDNVMVREFLRRPRQLAIDLGTAFWLMAYAAITSLIILCVYMKLFEREHQYTLYALLASSILLFQPFGVIVWFFQSRVQSKIVAVCNITGLITSSTIKIIAVSLHANLLVFFFIILLEQTFLATLYLSVGRRKGLPVFFPTFSKERAKELIRTSSPLIFTALAVTIYMRIDQIMIKSMLGEHQVGIYAAAARFYEAWITIPYLLTVSLLPAIIQSKEQGEAIYHQRLVYLFRFIFWISVAVTLFVVTCSRWIILHSLGSSYLEASSVLAIVMFTAAWTALGSGSIRYLIAEGFEKKIAIRTIVTAVINFSLNLILIPCMGIQGSAIATLVSIFIANYLWDWFDPDLKPLLNIKHKAVLFIDWPKIVPSPSTGIKI